MYSIHFKLAFPCFSGTALLIIVLACISQLHLWSTSKSKVGIASQVGFWCFLRARCVALRDISSYRK
jgi:hypothetical protein